LTVPRPPQPVPPIDQCIIVRPARPLPALVATFPLVRIYLLVRIYDFSIRERQTRRIPITAPTGDVLLQARSAWRQDRGCGARAQASYLLRRRIETTYARKAVDPVGCTPKRAHFSSPGFSAVRVKAAQTPSFPPITLRSSDLRGGGPLASCPQAELTTQRPDQAER
jgi:hypothetical protein